MNELIVFHSVRNGRHTWSYFSWNLLLFVSSYRNCTNFLQYHVLKEFITTPKVTNMLVHLTASLRSYALCNNDRICQ